MKIFQISIKSTTCK